MDRDITSMDEAALAAELAGLAADPAGAEGLLAQLASALFPAGAGGIEHVTWAESDHGAAAALAERSDAEARLRAAEIRYRSLVEQIPAVTFMAVLGEGENEVYVSPHIEALLGFSQKEWLEDPFLWYRP